MVSMLKLASCTATAVGFAEFDALAAEVEPGGGATEVIVVEGAVIVGAGTIGVVWDG